MKENTHLMTVIAIFSVGAVVASGVSGWNFTTAQSVGGVRGEESSAYSGEPQADPASSIALGPGVTSSQGTQEGGDSGGSGPTDGMVQPPPPPPIQEIQPSATDGNWPNRVNGLNGVNGINGVNGLNGINGINWPNGINGINGINGLNGINGVNSMNGINGMNAVRSTPQTQVGGVPDGKAPARSSQKRKPWWKDLGRGPAPLETVVPEAWQKVPGGGAEAESEDFNEEEEPWSSFMDATEPSDDEEGVEVVSPSAPVGSETVLSWVRDAIGEVGEAINAFFSDFFSY